MANDFYISDYTGTQMDAADAASIVFEAVFGSTTYAEVIAAKNVGKTVQAKHNFKIYQLAQVVAPAILFTMANAGAGTIQTLILSNTDVWTESTLDINAAIEAAENGEKPLLIAGNAEQILSTDTLNDKTPYTFRKTAGGADVGNLEYDTLIGGTVAWNQLAKNGNFADGTTNWYASSVADATISVSDGVLSLTAAKDAPYVWASASQGTTPYMLAGHKYIILAVAKGAHGIPSCGISQSQPTVLYSEALSGGWYRISRIFEKQSGGTVIQVYFGTDNASYLTGESAQFKSIMLYDLTQMFGTTIADYIYSLESGTAGAGVAWLQNHGYFTQDYYAYDAGSLQSVCAAAHVIGGQNILPDIVYQNNTAEVFLGVGADGWLALKAGTYTISYGNSVLGRIFYKEQGGSNIALSSTASGTFTLAADANVRIWLYNSSGVTASDVAWAQLELGSTATPYTPYVMPTIYPLDSSLTLRGVPKLDANNKLYYDGDKYTADGNVTRRFAVVDMGTLGWLYNSTNDFFAVSLVGNKYQAPLIAVGYVYVGEKSDTAMATVANMSIADNSGVWLKVKNTAYTDAAAFKAAMSGVMLQYELATPTAETATPYASPQSIANGGTEEYTDAGVEAGTRDVAIPAGHDTDYTLDLRGEIERVIGQVPPPPTANGTYTLKVTVSGGVATYSWA